MGTSTFDGIKQNVREAYVIRGRPLADLARIHGRKVYTWAEDENWDGERRAFLEKFFPLVGIFNQRHIQIFDALLAQVIRHLSPPPPGPDGKPVPPKLKTPKELYTLTMIASRCQCGQRLAAGLDVPEKYARTANEIDLATLIERFQREAEAAALEVPALAVTLSGGGKGSGNGHRDLREIEADSAMLDLERPPEPDLLSQVPPTRQDRAGPPPAARHAADGQGDDVDDHPHAAPPHGAPPQEPQDEDDDPPAPLPPMPPDRPSEQP